MPSIYYTWYYTTLLGQHGRECQSLRDHGHSLLLMLLGVKMSEICHSGVSPAVIFDQYLAPFIGHGQYYIWLVGQLKGKYYTDMALWGVQYQFLLHSEQNDIIFQSAIKIDM